MDKPAIYALSAGLQPLASGLTDVLQEMTGKPVAFMLVCGVGGSVQYVSNVERAQAKELLTELLQRWEAGRADIPAHMNPDLMKPGA
jgi:hypothetical protein